MRRRDFAGARGGAAALEFALISPLLILLAWGMISFGGYFYTSHIVQQMANDAARASIAGLDDSERDALARECIDAERAGLARLPGEAVSVSTQRRGESFSVNVTYDASRNAFWAFGRLGPFPSTQLRRSGIILVGGY